MSTTFVDINLLQLNRQDIFLAMGIPHQTHDELSQTLLNAVEAEMKPIVKPQLCYRFIEKHDFVCGSIIAKALENADKYAVIVATAGVEAEAWLKELQQQNIAKMYAADVALSEVVEATMRKAIGEIQQKVLPNMVVGNPYSPGYCGWSLREQKKLFACFDAPPCGVTLNDSCLMFPIKSVSAVVPIGANVVKQPYGCAVCSKEDCYKRKKTT